RRGGGVDDGGDAAGLGVEQGTFWHLESAESVSGQGGSYGKLAPWWPQAVDSTPRPVHVLRSNGAFDATGTAWCAGVRQGDAGLAPEGAPAGAARVDRRPAARGSEGGQPAGRAGQGSHGPRRAGLRRNPARHA